MRVNIALLTVTDTRTLKDDKSGAILTNKISESNHNLVDYPPSRLIEEPVFSRPLMAVTKCRSCGAEIRAEGLPPSFGGYNVYCVTCGAQFRVD